MPIPFYLAMTAAEIAACTALPPHIGWMACHFSLSGTGLSNIPKTLPPQSVLILDDSTPMAEHQASVIISQLKEVVSGFDIYALIMDFQRPLQSQTQDFIANLQSELSCFVAAPPGYGQPGHSVFLPPCPPNRLLKDYISPFQGEDVFLEIALDGLKLTITDKGCTKEPLFSDNDAYLPRQDVYLHCHYRIVQADENIAFHLHRTPDDVSALLDEAASLNIRHCIGLWQEFRN